MYIPFGLLELGRIAAWKRGSWMLGGVVARGRLDGVVLALHLFGGAALFASAVAIGFPPFALDWWRPLAILGALAGVSAFAVLWDGRTRLFTEEGGIGAIVSLIVLICALTFPGAFE